MGRQLNAEGITGEINVLDNGAYGDGRDDAPGFNRTISKAQAYGIADVIVPATTPSDYGLASTIVVPRDQRIKFYGAAIQWLLTSGTMFQIGTAAGDLGWQQGGIWGGKLLGGGGTSVGVQIGNGTASAQGVRLDGPDISGFQHGIKITSGAGGPAFLMHLINCIVHNNSGKGVYFLTPNGCEQATIIGGDYFSNQHGIYFDPTCAGTRLLMLGGAVDGNGILLDAGSTCTLTLDGTHMEWDSGAEYIFVDNQGGGNVFVTNAEMAKVPNQATTLPLIRNMLASLTVADSTFSATQLGASIIRMGNGGVCTPQTNVHGCQFYPGASPATGALLWDWSASNAAGALLRWQGNSRLGTWPTPVWPASPAGALVIADDDPNQATAAGNVVQAGGFGSLLTGGGRSYNGSGAPSKPNGVNPTAGDYYFRTDTPSTANQRLYVCTVGGGTPTWVGIV